MRSIPYILATAGHVDHGKSALVRALTGTDPDRLPEEKARGITIDLGFAHLALPSPAGADPATYQVGIVDVPGHEDFVKNMVAGVGSIDAALLVVAADDGWMPQTEEHLQILEYLGVTRVVVALTKCDLLESIDSAIAGVRATLTGSTLASATIIPTSAHTGKGLADLKAALATMFAATPAPADIGKPRLPLDRVFVLKGVGTIVTGTLTGGALRRDQQVAIQPTGATARVRTIQTHNRDVAVALPGSRVALNLPDLYPVAVRGSRQSSELMRGDVVTLPNLATPTETWDVVLHRFARAGPLTLRQGLPVQVHHGSAAIAARLSFLDVPELPPGGRAIAQLRLERPALAFAGDRFVLRDGPEQQTLAGGIVLDPRAARERWRSAARRTFLQPRAEEAAPVAAFVATQLAHDGLADRATLLAQSRFGAAEVEAAVAAAVGAGTAVSAGPIVADAKWWAEVRARAVAAIDAVHREHPERAGLTLADLRAAIPAAVADAVLADLCHNGFARSGAVIRRATFQPALPPRLQSAGAKLRKSLAAHPFDPPSRKELAPDALAQQALRFLLINGEAVDVAPEVVLSSEAIAKAIAMVRDHIGRHGPALVSELKTALGSSRRIMVPLLEKLDRDGITRREGDRRVLR